MRLSPQICGGSICAVRVLVHKRCHRQKCFKVALLRMSCPSAQHLVVSDMQLQGEASGPFNILMKASLRSDGRIAPRRASSLPSICFLHPHA